MKFNLKKLIPVIALAVIIITITSCNRGVGCPSDFSLLSSFLN